MSIIKDVVKIEKLLISRDDEQVKEGLFLLLEQCEDEFDFFRNFKTIYDRLKELDQRPMPAVINLNTITVYIVPSGAKCCPRGLFPAMGWPKVEYEY